MMTRVTFLSCDFSKISLNHRFKPTKSLGLGLVMACVATLSGCTTFKQNVADSSLDYQKTAKLDPIVLPADAQTLPFIPMYTVPQTGTNTLKLKSDKSKRFELPRPISTIK